MFIKSVQLELGIYNNRQTRGKECLLSMRRCHKAVDIGGHAGSRVVCRPA